MLELTPLIPALPLAGSALIACCGRRLPGQGAYPAIATLAAGWLISAGILWQSLARGAHAPHWERSIIWAPTGDYVLRMGLALDGLGLAMLLVVTTVSLLVHIYSVGYMHGDPRYPRFFSFLQLFSASMLMLVLADNLLLLYISWELVGLSSYLLIGFWFQKPEAMRAAKKAFIVTRLGDVGLFLGLLTLFNAVGSVAFRDIFAAVERDLATTMVSFTLPLIGKVVWPLAAVAAILIFFGAMGKSAQFPLHVWLPDAMEGPTPVSALIHAATMVAAGVYLVARTLPLFIAGFAVADAPALHWVAVIGAITALLGATIGLAQDDIKRVLAYSTISQLGYMMMGLGLGSLVAGIFHLLTHAFFKALLFLGAGSVIHGVEHGYHAATHGDHAHTEHFSPNDMKMMGGLRHRMPRTFVAYLAGALALVGIVPFAGFWSKDEILAEAFHLWRADGALNLPFWVWLAGTLGAFFTALYMGRQLGLVFWGEPRHAAARHAHESPSSMTVPLLILALFALLFGFVNAPFLGSPLHHFMGDVHEASEVVHAEAIPFNVTVAGISTVLAVAGLLLGWGLYRNYRVGQVEPFRMILGPVFTLLRNKYYIDEFYRWAIIRPVVWLSEFCFNIDDRWIIDPFVDLVGAAGRAASDVARVVDSVVIDRWFVEGTAQLFNAAGRWLRYSETGYVQNYLLVVAVTILLLLGLYLYF